MKMTLFCLDFSGSGLSDGEFISLGHYEREDLKVVIDYLRNSGKVSTIGLWGRSMGAVTALMHADRDPSIAGLVLDSPFASLSRLSKELFRKYSKRIPTFLFSLAFALVKSTIKKKARFDISKIEPVKHVGASFVPALFICARDDDFIDPSHSKQMFSLYQGEKNFLLCEGSHNTPRQSYVLTSASIFLRNATLAGELPELKPKVALLGQPNPKYFPPWSPYCFRQVPVDKASRIVQSVSRNKDDLVPRKTYHIREPRDQIVKVKSAKLRPLDKQESPAMEQDDDMCEGHIEELLVAIPRPKSSQLPRKRIFEDQWSPFTAAGGAQMKRKEEHKKQEASFDFEAAVEKAVEIIATHKGGRQSLRERVWGVVAGGTTEQREMVLEMLG